MRPGDQASATVLAMQDEMTALGLLRDGSGGGGEQPLIAPRNVAVQPCGTAAAAQRHRRAGEQPCDPCRAAEVRREAEYRARAMADPVKAARIREKDNARLARYRARKRGVAA